MIKRDQYPGGALKWSAAAACGVLMLVGCSAKSGSVEAGGVKPDCKLASTDVTAVSGSGYDAYKIAGKLNVDAEQVASNGIIAAIKCKNPISEDEVGRGQSNPVLVEGIAEQPDELVKCLPIGFATEQPPQSQKFEDDVLAVCA